MMSAPVPAACVCELAGLEPALRQAALRPARARPGTTTGRSGTASCPRFTRSPFLTATVDHRAGNLRADGDDILLHLRHCRWTRCCRSTSTSKARQPAGSAARSASAACAGATSCGRRSPSPRRWPRHRPLQPRWRHRWDPSSSRSCARPVLVLPCRDIGAYGLQLARGSARRRPRRSRRALRPTNSVDQAAQLRRRPARHLAVSSSRQARRSAGSRWRSTRPASSRRSTIRHSVIGSMSSLSASSTCRSPGSRFNRARTRHCARVTPSAAARWSKARRMACAVSLISKSNSSIGRAYNKRAYHFNSFSQRSRKRLSLGAASLFSRLARRRHSPVAQR